MSHSTWNESGPECPYCGHVETPDEAVYFDESMTRMECGDCGQFYRCRYYRLDRWTGDPLPNAVSAGQERDDGV